MYAAMVEVPEQDQVGQIVGSATRPEKGRLDHSWVMADMKKYDGAVPLLEHDPQILTKYP